MMRKLIICSIILLVCSFTIYYCYSYEYKAESRTYSLDSLNVKIRIERLGDSQMRINFSRSADFRSDYIQFKTNDLYHDVDIYIFDGDEIKAVGREPLTAISSKEFNISEFKVIHPKDGYGKMPYYSDSSFVKQPCFYLNFSKSMNEFEVIDTKDNQVVYVAETLNLQEFILKTLLVVILSLIALFVVIFRKTKSTGDN